MSDRLLPKDKTTFYDDDARCPWCAAYVEDAAIPIALIFSARVHGEFRYAKREADDQASVNAMQTDCPSCARPFMVAFQKAPRIRDEPTYWVCRALAVRTAADAELRALPRAAPADDAA